MKFSNAEIAAQLQSVYQTNAGSNDLSYILQDSALSSALAPIIRNIAASKQQDAFLRQLKTFIEAKETEIEGICREHSQDFVQSTDKLLKVRQGTVSLKHRVAELNEDIQTKGGQVATKKRLLLENKRIAANIDDSIETLTACLRVLDLSTKIHKLIQVKKYYSALKALDELASERIKTVANVSAVFADRILSTLPALKASIKEASLKEFKAWLYEAREISQKLGQRAMRRMQIRSTRWMHRKSKDVDGTLRSAKVNSAVELVVSERHAFEYDPFNASQTDGEEELAIDFRPLHHCILIYDLLECQQELQSSYAQDRRAQASLLLSSISLTPFSSSALQALLDEMTGFFIIEARVQQTTAKDFRTSYAVNDLWDSTIDRTIQAMSEGLRACQEPEAYLEAKLSSSLFSQTMAAQGYDLSAFDTFLNHLFERFAELLERKCSIELEAIVKEDEHISNMLVNNLEDFDKVAQVSWLPETGQWSEMVLKEQEFPLVLPFSQTYPLCCIDIRNFIDQLYQFVESDSRRSPMLDVTARKAVDRMLSERISLKIRNQVRNMRNISQIALVAVNLLFFETACCELELLLGQLRSNARPNQEPIPVNLDSVISFRDTLEATQNHLNTLIARKLDEFFELAEYDWTPPVPPPSDEVSSYLVEMVDYLTLVIDQTLAILPQTLTNAVYKSALIHCEDRLMSYLISSEPSQLNDYGLSSLAADARFIAQHASNINSPSPDSHERLDQVFEELSQMVAVLQSDSMAEFLDPDIRELAFPRIQAKKLQYALIKLATYYNAEPGAGNVRRKREMEQVLKTISRDVAA